MGLVEPLLPPWPEKSPGPHGPQVMPCSTFDSSPQPGHAAGPSGVRAGNTRGTKPTTWVSTDENHGYLGQPTDATTGLDLLGARNYDPAQGRFLTPDPIFQAGDPNQMGGYTYAADNPASSSDPTGCCCSVRGRRP
ncbi:RHS repeat-associated core domain-containing protein [Streptomyces sp. NPDC007162]|uniref:RHS repeat-associated core domain-containing protein n=1 Tax=Streptomyces sp. NPDC007162 TaxID=3156917 RepID=UPI0033E8715B